MVTLKDIAQKTECSVAAVSLVLNGKAGNAIREELRKKILHTARQLGYRKNAVAVNLQKQRTGRLAILVPEPLAQISIRGNTSFFETLSGVISAASHHRYSCGIASADGTHNTGKLVDLLTDQQLEGVFFFHRHWDGRDLDRIRKALQDADIAGVALTFSERPSFPGTFVDRLRTGRAAAAHLRECGVRRVAFVGHGDEGRSHHYGDLKVRGLVGSLRETYPDAPWFTDPREVLSQPSLPDGIFCEDNLVAQRVWRAAREAGHRVPEELQLLGHGEAVTADMFSERLSYMRSVTTEQGPLAMELMREVLEGRRPEPRELIEALVVQETTRPEKRTRGTKPK